MRENDNLDIKLYYIGEKYYKKKNIKSEVVGFKKHPHNNQEKSSKGL